MKTQIAVEKAAPKLTPCACKCGGFTRGGRYIQGHDAKHKSALIHAALHGRKRAITALEKLGWTKFLIAKQARQVVLAEAGFAVSVSQ